jgi:indolepyruvate ferredoxin oxidoreductase
LPSTDDAGAGQRSAELKDWINLNFCCHGASCTSATWSTNQADGGGSVEVRPNQFPFESTHNKFTLDTRQIDFDRNVLLPPRTWRKEQQLHERFERLWASARRHGANRVIPAVAETNSAARLGFIPRPRPIVICGMRWPNLASTGSSRS